MSALLYCLISIIEKLKICEDHLFHFYISVAKIVISSFQPLKENRFVIPKSRYDSISTYLSPEGNKYSDIDLVHDKEIYQQLVDAGLFLFYLITCIMYFCHNAVVWNPPVHDADSQMAKKASCCWLTFMTDTASLRVCQVFHNFLSLYFNDFCL